MEKFGQRLEENTEPTSMKGEKAGKLLEMIGYLLSVLGQTIAEESDPDSLLPELKSQVRERLSRLLESMPLEPGEKILLLEGRPSWMLGRKSMEILQEANDTLPC